MSMLSPIMPRKKLSEMTDQEDRDDSYPLLRPGIQAIVSTRMEAVFSRAEFDLTTWVSEVRAIAQAAATCGDFKTAFTGYEMLGRHMGARLSDNAPSQHVHFHGKDEHDVREASQSALEARLQQLRVTSPPTPPQAQQTGGPLDDLLA